MYVSICMLCYWDRSEIMIGIIQGLMLKVKTWTEFVQLKSKINICTSTTNNRIKLDYCTQPLNEGSDKRNKWTDDSNEMGKYSPKDKQHSETTNRFCGMIVMTQKTNGGIRNFKQNIRSQWQSAWLVLQFLAAQNMGLTAWSQDFAITLLQIWPSVLCH